SLIKFVPRPVTVGFTAGIAVIHFTGQIANFLGLTNVKRHEYFIANTQEIMKQLGTINMYSILTAVICFVTILMTPKFLPKVP
ncbi:SulP family inorganic anion transporter, partial [Bacillus velezensis]|uniref:SulP family inorganic anion transporter n=1 Tax=Bacillus velezensis TaxID=492670 RepID=UPI00201BDCC5